MADPILAPAGPLAPDGGTSIAVVSNQPVAWETTGGVLSDVAAASVTWEIPNRAGTLYLYGTNANDEQDVLVAVVRAVIPNYWTFQNPVNASLPVLTFVPYYGPSQQRGFGGNEFIHDWELSNPTSTVERFKELKAFLEWHYSRGLPFDLIDPVLHERRTYKGDSNLAYSYTPAGFVSWSVRIKEEYPYVGVPA